MDSVEDLQTEAYVGRDPRLGQGGGGGGRPNGPEYDPRSQNNGGRGRPSGPEYDPRGQCGNVGGGGGGRPSGPDYRPMQGGEDEFGVRAAQP